MFDHTIAADENPVKCGDLNCEYPNACTANLAGFAETTQCSPVNPPAEECPEPGSGGACTMEKKPVVCNGCPYDNDCLANQAGFVPNQCETPTPCNPTTDADCEEKPDVPPPCNPTTSADCEEKPVAPPPCNPTTDANCPKPETTGSGPATLENDSGAGAYGLAGGLVAGAVAFFMV